MDIWLQLHAMTAGFAFGQVFLGWCLQNCCDQESLAGLIKQERPVNAKTHTTKPMQEQAI